MTDKPEHCNLGDFDVAVVGGGVVGCAVARRLTLEGARVVLLEKDPDILAGASKGNSALLHTGFDAPPGSLELACVRAGYAEYLSIRTALNLPLLETGALVLAWSEAEEERLAGIAERAHENGIDDVSLMGREAVLAREPELAPSVRAGLLVPGEHVIDPWSAPLAYLSQAIANGARVLRGTEVLGGAFEAGRWRLETSGGGITARYVVNCAGLFGDLLEERLLGDASFAIRPRKGEFVVFDKAAAKLIRSTLLPVPTPVTKGVVIARTIFGNVLVGPTAEEQDDRCRARVSEEVLQRLIGHAATLVPRLAEVPVTAIYAGLRPATETKEYRIRREPARNWLTLGGIRSTGLTSALGLAQHAARCLSDMGWSASALAEPVVTPVPNLAEDRPRDWQAPDHGEIICHCEMVTRREIEATFASPLPPGNFGGLKRRTRAGMGRCQGFYCSGRLARLSGRRLTPPLAVADETQG